MAAASGGEAWPPPTPSPTPSPTASSAAGTRRRARFDAADDLCIVQAVRRYEPYAAGHGSKVRVWEQVARDTQQHAGSRNLRISSRAVSDRFRLLMRMHKNGSLQERHRNDVNAEVVDATSEALRAVAGRMDEIRDQAGHVRKRRRGLGRRPLLDGLTVPESVEVDFAVSATPSAEPTTLRLRSDEDTDSSPLHVLASADDMTLVLPSPPPQPPTATTTPERSEALTSKTQQLLELRREKLELKKRKLELLERQHAERMALLQRRLDLEEQRAQREAAARRDEWAALLAALRALQPPGAELGAASSSAMDVGASLSDF